MHIGLKIKELAEHKKLSAQKIGNAIGVSKQAVYDIFQKEELSTGVLKRVANYLGVPISVFFDERENINESATSGDGGVSATGQAHVSVGFNQQEHDELIRMRVENKFLKESNAEKDERIAELKERIEELKAQMK